ncbi:serine hydrolase domain-containing protein [Maribacter sp. CXY002]|uniref:serine hydrolase domain-containing protein n=1 Tax=Maribacter luteocoastalis TaxID=3407671 RepID=UPI003B6741E5
MLLLSCCTATEIVYHNFSSVTDHKLFPNRELIASESTYHFTNGLDATRVPKRINYSDKINIPLDGFLESNKTAAFLIIKKDTLIMENYYNGYNESSILLSFSMSKSFFSILIGCAIEDGYIKSVEQSVTDFVPELKKNGFKRVTIEHLLQMTSGMAYTETDTPFSNLPRFYYGKNLKKRLFKLRLKEKPGSRFQYNSGESQLLGLILERALKTQTITEYMQDKIWEPLGMEYSGLWSLDRADHGLEKVFCCLGATARDFAKFGRLYLHKGNWNGEQLVPRHWVEQSTKIDSTEGSAWNYQYQWQLVSKENGDYLASGHHGQYLYVHPKRRLIIVRLGEKKGVGKKTWIEIFVNLSKEIS